MIEIFKGGLICLGVTGWGDAELIKGEVEAASPPATRLSGCRPRGPAPLKKDAVSCWQVPHLSFLGGAFPGPLITAESLLFDCKRPWCQMKVLRWRGQFYLVRASSKHPNPPTQTPVHAIRQGQMHVEMLATPLWHETVAQTASVSSARVEKQWEVAAGLALIIKLSNGLEEGAPPLLWEHLKDWKRTFHEFFKNCSFFPTCTFSAFILHLS